MNETELKIEIGGLYRTHVGELVKIVNIKEEEDVLHIYNINENANQWVSLSRAKKFKLKTRIR